MDSFQSEVKEEDLFEGAQTLSLIAHLVLSLIGNYLPFIVVKKEKSGHSCPCGIRTALLRTFGSEDLSLM